MRSSRLLHWVAVDNTRQWRKLHRDNLIALLWFPWFSSTGKLCRKREKNLRETSCQVSTNSKTVQWWKTSRRLQWQKNGRYIWRNFDKFCSRELRNKLLQCISQTWSRSLDCFFSAIIHASARQVQRSRIFPNFWRELRIVSCKDTYEARSESAVSRMWASPAHQERLSPVSLSIFTHPIGHRHVDLIFEGRRPVLLWEITENTTVVPSSSFATSLETCK